MRVEADHFVMLGSAGMAGSVDGAQSLGVPNGQVFASQGHHDGWAPTGQAVSQRQDPTSPSFGAHVFSSEAGVDSSGNRLDEITQHGPFAPGDRRESHSYLDANTTALYNTALATSGRGDEIPVGGSPADRLAQQAQDRMQDLIESGTLWSPGR
jgi:hypothetical protein